MKLNTLDKKKMLDYIIEAINTSEITVYAVSKATNVRQTTIHNIVNGKTKEPHENNLIAIYDYLLKKQSGSESAKVFEITKNEKPLKSSSSFDNLLDEKMKIIIKEYSDEKFKEINNHLLFLLRKVSDLESLNKELRKEINKDQSNIS